MINKTKVFSLCVLSLFAFVAISGFASAASLTISNENFPTSVNHDDGSFDFSFDITNTGAADSAISFVLVMTAGQATLTMSDVPIADGSVTPVTITVTGRVDFPAHQSGALVGRVVVDDTGGGTPKDVNFNVAITDEPSIKLTEKVSITESRNGSIEVENDGSVDWSNVVLTATGDFQVEFYDDGGDLITGGLVIAAGEKETVTVAPTDLGDVGFGGESITITATANSATTATLTMTVEGSFCEAGEVGGSLEIAKINIENIIGDDNEWRLLDTIEIEVKVENNGNDKLKDIIVELGFFDNDGKDQVGDLEFDNADEEKIELGNLGENKDETVTFNFKVPADFEDGNYKLTVKAY
ncbi:MAG: putative S-layer protein, partial [Nanoarchaeota archaeon]